MRVRMAIIIYAYRCMHLYVFMYNSVSLIFHSPNRPAVIGLKYAENDLRRRAALAVANATRSGSKAKQCERLHQALQRARKHYNANFPEPEDVIPKANGWADVASSLTTFVRAEATGFLLYHMCIVRDHAAQAARVLTVAKQYALLLTTPRNGRPAYWNATRSMRSCTEGAVAGIKCVEVRAAFLTDGNRKETNVGDMLTGSLVSVAYKEKGRGLVQCGRLKIIRADHVWIDKPRRSSHLPNTYFFYARVHPSLYYRPACRYGSTWSGTPERVCTFLL